MSDKIGIVLLAAGEGKRLKLSVPKPLAPLNNKKLIDFPLKAAEKFTKENSLESKVAVVVGHKREMVISHLENKGIEFPVQEQQLGTADALRSYFNDTSFSKDCSLTLVLCADTPLLNDEILSCLYKELKENKLDGVAATFKENNPYGYGRIVRGDKGFNIVEEKDATDEQRSIQEVNSGLYLFKTDYILSALEGVDSDNKAGEFYLTDVFQKEANVKAFCFDNKDLFLGVNTLVQLEQARKILNKNKVNNLLNNGVIVIDPDTVYVDDEVEVAAEVTLYPNTFLMGKTTIATKTVIEPGCIVKNSTIGEGVSLKAYSHLENVIVEKNCAVGPFARLRPGTELGEKTKIGNFVETKNSKLDKGVAVSHLSYVGDAEIGEETNIGCGFITCNYDGEQKHKTIIGKRSFIGSDTQTIAPIKIGDNSFIGSGSTVSRDVPDKAFSIARGRQEIKENLAHRFLRGKWKVDK
jgi:bifunctional UDP-N-acetylglucosamine pyrophosphorylase/glucosamine-1-phosphate N-acetyltransferase